jgi:RNA polymerase sigma-70 factor (ECF subfamily)
VVHPLRFKGDDVALVRALQADHPGAYKELYRRYAHDVYRVLFRVMGPDADMEELLHEVFVRAFRHVAAIRSAAELRAWLAGIAVYVARGAIRKRKRKKWLQFFEPSSLPESGVPAADDEARRALMCTYKLLDRLSEEKRVAFTLRYIDGRELTDVATMCQVSLATIKRRLKAAKRHFFAMARREPELEAWLNDD